MRKENNGDADKQVSAEKTGASKSPGESVTKPGGAVQGELGVINEDVKNVKQSAKKKAPVKQKKTVPKLLLLTHQTNLLRMVAGGLITPQVQMNEPVQDPSSLCGDRLVLWVGQIPENIVSEFFGDRAGNIPVAVELDPAGLTGKNIPALDVECGAVEVGLPKLQKNIRSLFIGGVIPAGSVVALHFESELELGEFNVREFEDVKIDGSLTGVSPELFTGDDIDLKALRDGISRMPPCKSMGREGLILAHDKILGGLTMLCACLPQKLSWLKVAETAFQFDPAKKGGKGKQPHGLAWFVDMVHDRNVPPGGIDLDIFVTAAGILRKTNPAKGYENQQLISDILGAVRHKISDEAEIKKTVEWEKYLNDVLMGMKRVSELSDDRSIGMRALLYFLILGDPSAIHEERNPVVKAGPEVRLFAAVLAGLYHGRSRMPLKLKEVALPEESLMAISSHAINRLTDKPFSTAGKSELIRKIETSSEDPTELSARLTIGGKPFLQITEMPSHSMMSLYYEAKDAGFELKYHFDLEAFSYIHRYKDDRSQEIYIEVIPERGDQGKTFRFLSRCMDIGRNSKKTLPYDMMYRLLERNCDKTMHCRFGIDTKSNTLVVLSDQQMETMDRSEFEHKFHYVALVADEFEKNMGVDKY
ncbi:YbjN domain-containing protein [bacterium]|nr:YbjN domain-containing protein [bacterium]